MEPFLAEIRAFAFGITPRGWLPCEGQVLQILQNQALYSLLGSVYGGDGKTTFALPDLRGRVPLAATPAYLPGAAGGEAQHTLTIPEMPQHFHTISGSSDPVSVIPPTGNTWASFASGYSTTTDVQMSPTAIGTTGASEPHPNMQPYMAVNFCIAVQGIFPSRN